MLRVIEMEKRVFEMEPTTGQINCKSRHSLHNKEVTINIFSRWLQ